MQHRMNKWKENRWLGYLYCLWPMLFTCAAAIFFGKDVNFDAINYHAYAALALFEGRINTDFLPAGPQSYLNPVGYIPFYLMRIWLSDFWVSICLAALHSGSIYALVYLARELICKFNDTYVYYLAIALAVSTTVFWQIVGSSFVDGYVCTLVLFGLVYILRCCKSVNENEGCANFIISAMFFGVATGLKLTAVVFSISAACIVFFYFALIRRQWRNFLSFGLMGIVSFLLVEGWWAWLVFERTGNPFFPYFNNIFESPYYPAQAISNARFVPEGLWDALLFPLRAIMPAPWLYQELRAPDVRFAAFFILLISVFIIVGRKLKFHVAGLISVNFFLISFVLWLFTTGNGRYAIPLFLLLGVLIAWCTTVLFRQSLAKSILLAIFLLQATCLYVGGSFRWSEVSFSSDWFGYKVPHKLIAEPALYLTLDPNSYSFLAGEVNPSSIFTNISGQLALPLSDEFNVFLEKSARNVSERVRSLSKIEFDKIELTPRYIYVMNSKLSRFGYEVDSSDCLYIEPESKAMFDVTPLLISCGLKFNSKISEKFNFDVMKYDMVFNAIEKKCPTFFNPKTSFTEKFGDLWIRRYLGSEVKMYVSQNTVWMEFSDRIAVINLGLFSSLSESVADLSCENNLVRVSLDAW